MHPCNTYMTSHACLQSYLQDSVHHMCIVMHQPQHAGLQQSPAHGHKRGLHRTDLLSFNLRVQGHGMRGCTLPGIISP